MNAGNIVDAFVSDSKWNSVPAKRLFTSSKEINQGMKESNRLALTMKGVINRSLDDLQGLQSSDYSVYQIFEKDDLVFKLIDLENIKTSRVLMNPLMILVKIIKLRWIHILSYDQMVSRKINNQTTRCANSIFYTTLFTNSAPNYT